MTARRHIWYNRLEPLRNQITLPTARHAARFMTECTCFGSERSGKLLRSLKNHDSGVLMQNKYLKAAILAVCSIVFIAAYVLMLMEYQAENRKTVRHY